MKLFNNVITFVVTRIGRIKWRLKTNITESEKNIIAELLKKDYYIICTRRKNYLSTFLIGLANFLLTGKWGHYSHVLMNLEDRVIDNSDFRLVEAVGSGVKWSTFDEVFNGVTSVCILRPKNIDIDDWTLMLDRAKTEIGKPYDTLFDLKNDSKLSCVELVRNILLSTPNYFRNFKNFEDLITRSKNLTPQMFYDCEDFEIVFEIRH